MSGQLNKIAWQKELLYLVLFIATLIVREKVELKADSECLRLVMSKQLKITEPQAISLSSRWRLSQHSPRSSHRNEAALAYGGHRSHCWERDRALQAIVLGHLH